MQIGPIISATHMALQFRFSQTSSVENEQQHLSHAMLARLSIQLWTETLCPLQV